MRHVRGFSLLEVMLAMGLVILMMAAVYGFYDYCLASRSLGETRVHQAQVARMLLEQIAHDLRGIAPNTVKYTPVLRANDEILECLTVALPDPRLFADRRVTQRRVAAEMDLRRIMWFLAYDEDELDEDGEPVVVGLVRRTQKNLLPFGQFGSQELLEEDEQTFQDQLVSTEIRYLEFAYYDGTKWRQKWEMPEGPAGTIIPMAIRVTLGFEPIPVDELDNRREEFTDSDYMEADPEAYRHRYTTIVRLPAADVMLGTVSRLRNQAESEFGS